MFLRVFDLGSARVDLVEYFTVLSRRLLIFSFLPEVREFIKDTRPKTNTTRGGRKAHRPTPKTRTIHPTVLPDR